MILQHNIFTNITVNQVKLFHLSFLCRRIWWSLNFRLWSFIGDHKMICLNTLNELVVLKIAWIWKKWDYSADCWQQYFSIFYFTSGQPMVKYVFIYARPFSIWLLSSWQIFVFTIIIPIFPSKILPNFPDKIFVPVVDGRQVGGGDLEMVFVMVVGVFIWKKYWKLSFLFAIFSCTTKHIKVAIISDFTLFAIFFSSVLNCFVLFFNTVVPSMVVSSKWKSFRSLVHISLYVRSVSIPGNLIAIFLILSWKIGNNSFFGCEWFSS